MTPLEILTNVGKLLGFMGIALFIVVSVLSWWVYWINDERKNYPGMPKKYKMLFQFGKYEIFGLLGAAVLMVSMALLRVFWKMVTTGW